MEFKTDLGTLTLDFSGRIDSSNAEATGVEAERICAENEHSALIIDADKLEYISSAGLRLILKLLKANPGLRVINVNSEVYEILDMTGFTEMLKVEKAFRKVSVDGCTVIGRGAKGTVYRYNGDTIIKVYKNPDSLPIIERERQLARKAFVLGIPTAISYDVVKVGQSYGSVFELLDANSYSQMIAENPDKLEEYAKICAKLLKDIHSTEVKPTDMPDVKDLVYNWLTTVNGKMDEGDYNKLVKMVKAVPDVCTMIHGDFHTNNIMCQNGEVLLIDMDTLSHGHPIFELANVKITYVIFGEYDPSFVANFIGFDYDKAVKFWDYFFPAYLGTDDKEKLKEIDDKITLLSYLRLLHHNIRRGINTPELEKEVERIKAAVHELLGKVDSLSF